MKVITLLIVVFVFVSCRKEEEPDFPTLNNISGTWRLNSGYSSLTFTKNFEIIDSLFSDYYDTIIQVNKGSFKFINGFIQFDDLKPTYCENTSLISNFHYTYSTYKFQIVDDKLFMDERGLFKPIGHKGNTLDGKWQSNRNVIVYDTRQLPNFLSGHQIIEFDFIKNTNAYNINYWNQYGVFKDSLTDGPFKYRRNYQYLFPEFGIEAFGIFEENILTAIGVHRTYTKIKK